MATVEEFAALVEKEKREKDTHQIAYAVAAGIEDEHRTHIIPGRKYTKVDYGDSGFFMLDGDKIFGIKAYGVIHRGHPYGTLDTIFDWYWGDFFPRKLRT